MNSLTKFERVKSNSNYWLRYNRNQDGASLDITLGQAYTGGECATIHNVFPAFADRAVLALIKLIPSFEEWYDSL